MKILILILFCINIVVFSQNNSSIKYGKIEGLVIADNNEPLEYANIIVLENSFGTTSNKEGKFKFPKIAVGNKTIRISYLGYKTVTKKIEIKPNQTTTLKIVLTTESFEIGTITVTSKNEFIPIEPVSKTVITSGEIEHIQASSLKDLMSLVPGGDKENSTLNTASTAVIRGGQSVGTQIILDKVPISNNVNMQSGIGYTTYNRGTDLRAIPATNIESVEIIDGVPSVRYGDLTDGIVLVKTKTKPVKPNIKLKYNPNLTEGNATYGFSLGNWVLNNNLNIASSGRDVRIDGDGYTRVAFQTNFSRDFNKIRLKNSFYITKTFDERKEQPGYALKESWYNRDLTTRVNSNFEYKFFNYGKLESTFSFAYTKRNSYKQSIVSRDNMVISDRLIEGTQEGRIVFGSYLGKEWIKGEEYNIYLDANYSNKFYIGEFLNSFLIGFAYRNEFNKGAGIVFDPLYPPTLSTVSPRIRSYNELPKVEQLSFYAENKIVGRFIFPFTIVTGLRYEAFNPQKINFKGLIGSENFIKSQNGSFLNPRINLSFKIDEKTQLRLSYGITAKTPPLGMIAAQARYFDVVDTVSVENPEDASKNLAVVSTYIKERANPNMKAYKQKKYEIGIDKEFLFGGFTLTYFTNNTYNGFSSLTSPIVLNKWSYPDYPNFKERKIKERILTYYHQYNNSVTTKINGIELKFKTRRIPFINTVVKVDASYNYRHKEYSKGCDFGGMRIDKNLGGKVFPYFPNINTYNKRLKLNYRFDIQAETIGMWFTIHLEHYLLEINGYENNDEKYAHGYFSEEGKYVHIKKEERANPKFEKLRRSVRDFELLEEDYPQLFNLNLVVSKSLWKGTAVSFFVNNFFSSRPYHRLVRSSSKNPVYIKRNSQIFYGMELISQF